MNHGTGPACKCEVCKKRKGSGDGGGVPVQARMAEGAAPASFTSKENEEAEKYQPNYFTCLLEMLRKEGSLTRTWQEPKNMVKV